MTRLGNKKFTWASYICCAAIMFWAVSQTSAVEPIAAHPEREYPQSALNPPANVPLESIPTELGRSRALISGAYVELNDQGQPVPLSDCAAVQEADVFMSTVRRWKESPAPWSLQRNVTISYRWTCHAISLMPKNMLSSLLFLFLEPTKYQGQLDLSVVLTDDNIAYKRTFSRNFAFERYVANTPNQLSRSSTAYLDAAAAIMHEFAEDLRQARASANR